MGAFAVSAVAGSVLFALVYAWAQEPDAGTMMNPHVPMGSPAYRSESPTRPMCHLSRSALLTLLGLFLLNASPVKRLHGFVQFMICAAAGAALGRHEWALDGIVLSVIKAGSYGFLIFTTFRSNWWFYWDVPSRRTLGERIAASIFFTAIPPLGFAFGFWRLAFRIGIHDSTTTFVVDAAAPDAAPVEAIVEDPALEEHERRMSVIRAAQAGMGPARTPSANKDSVSSRRRWSSSASIPNLSGRFGPVRAFLSTSAIGPHRRTTPTSRIPLRGRSIARKR